MKIARQIYSLFALALSLAAFAAPGFATTLPLNEPSGLAVDASGNLYVANRSGNEVLIYTPAYAQKGSISKNVNQPTGVAIDLYGNLWVANFGASTVTEYVHGVQNTSAAITDSVAEPSGLLIDGLDNLWVVNADVFVTIYSPTAAYAPPSKLVQKIGPSGGVQAIAVGAGAFLHADGDDSNLFLESASAILQGEPLNGAAFGFTATALAPDDKGNVYGVNPANRIVFKALPNSTAINIVTLPATATVVFGMAVDNARGRVYISDFDNGKIFVYSTAGKLIHTIHN
jgi:streptogramin lyase